ncbi:hypothetical protein CPB85DRAFT_1299936 [Mucidula mucida]|nr:hypothetical protein CPB85DRAFT_1299936 [Mucidula mucida]
MATMDSERFYEVYPDVPPADIAPRPLAHGAEAVVEHVNGEVVIRLCLKAPVTSEISPLLTEAEWRKIDRDIDNASSFDLNIRNLEKPWEDVYLHILGALARGENEQISTKAQYLDIVNLEKSVRGTKGSIKEMIPDVANVLRLTLDPEGHHKFVSLVLGELKRAISRQHTCHWDPKTGRIQLSYQQIPNSEKAVKILLASLKVARRQVEWQALLQHCVYTARYGKLQPELVPILSREMVLIAAVGPWFMVAHRANCGEGWKHVCKAHPDLDDMKVLEKIRYQKVDTIIDGDDADPDEDLRQLKDSTVKFDFSEALRAVFDWDKELFNVRESRGWAVLQEIKDQMHDDISLFCNDGGDMIAMRVDVM